jgi:hypothetical protein
MKPPILPGAPRIPSLRSLGLALVAGAELFSGDGARAAETAGGAIRFNRDIRPLLSDNCFSCHGPDKNNRKSGLRLDDPEQPFLPSKSGAIAIVRGSPDKSELVARLYSTDKDEVMPTPGSHKTLTPAQKDLLKRWIEQGAPYEAHWAYITPKRAPVPALKDSARVRNAIDGFIQDALQARGLQPAAEAEPRTLLRRLSLDLTGLPPRPEEVEAFLADRSPNAFEKQVDRLLASPQYGERMAMQWLDVARYADTVGFHGDQNQNAWAYRDYVIAAYNQNKPFDQFTLEQLAGDLLPNPTPSQRVATCFNRLNMMTREGGAQPKEYLAKYATDRIRTVGMAWLGSTLQCAECHDHKFDPFTAKDFYSMGAFFSDVKQWGVYTDTRFSPNPDLKGFTNEHPFPPEIVVESPSLQRRVLRLKKEIAQAASDFRPDPRAFDFWKHQSLAFLQKHPAGWESLAPTVTVQPAPPPKGKAAPKAEAPQPTPAQEPGYRLEGERVVFEGKQGGTALLTMSPKTRSVAALKLELLPANKPGAKIVSNIGALVKVEVMLVPKSGKARELSVRHAQADSAAPRYSNGSEVIGVQSGWKIDPQKADRPATAVFFLDTPVQLAEGDSLQVRLPGNSVSALRLSVSPWAPMDLQKPGFGKEPAQLLATESAARALYLRSGGADAETYAKLKRLEARLLECREGRTPVMVTESRTPPLPVRLLHRGNWQDETGEICEPATPHFLPKLSGAAGGGGSRLDLARWLCAPENPLTSRVIINRLWKQFFGAGLSAQVDDFGAQGEPPSHPELLDWLAVEFRESGWNTKHMVKLLVMSHTYRQQSSLRKDLREIDPANRLLATQNPRRLEAEAVRDNALAIAGLLNSEMGGPSCRPFQPSGYYSGLQYPDRDYAPDIDGSQYRRGLYMHWQRTFLHPMLANFDAPSREDCVALRTNSNSPQQALTLLNDPQFVESARGFAASLLANPAGSDGERLQTAFLRALARPIKASERESLTAFLAKARQEYGAKPEDATQLQRVGSLPPSAAASPVELAAWTSVCRVLLNLHETLTRY